jgi:hypothetical protein
LSSLADENVPALVAEQIMKDANAAAVNALIISGPSLHISQADTTSCGKGIANLN